MRLELNNRLMAFMQTFENETKVFPRFVKIVDGTLFFFVGYRDYNSLDPKKIVQVRRNFKRLTGKTIRILGLTRDVEDFVIEYFKPFIELTRDNVKRDRRLLIITVDDIKKRSYILGRNGNRIKTLEKLLNELYRIRKIIVVVNENKEEGNKNDRE